MRTADAQLTSMRSFLKEELQRTEHLISVLKADKHAEPDTKGYLRGLREQQALIMLALYNT